MTNRRVEFIGYGHLPEHRAEQHTTIPVEQIEDIIFQINAAPAGQAAIFVCEDNLQASKVADRLRGLLGNKYVFSARRLCVYAQRVK